MVLFVTSYNMTRGDTVISYANQTPVSQIHTTGLQHKHNQAPTMSPLIAKAHQSTAKQDASHTEKVSVKNNRDLLMSQCIFMRPSKSRCEKKPMLAYKNH